MEMKQAGASMDSLISSFTTRISELQELVIARNIYPATAVADLSAIDTALTRMETQIQAIKVRLQEERDVIPKAKKLIEASQHQQRKLEHMLANIPLGMQETPSAASHNSVTFSTKPDLENVQGEPCEPRDESTTVTKEKKGRSAAPRWYITSNELESVPSYMRQRLTLDKINIAIGEIATNADANAQLISAPKKKMTDDTWEKALELRDISMAEAVKGKYFILESHIKGPGLKLDNTGKAILTVLRHLGRIQEARIGHHRVITLSKPM